MEKDNISQDNYSEIIDKQEYIAPKLVVINHEDTAFMGGSNNDGAPFSS
jgi:hypothetical protein